jgi:hypothetical protein
MDWTGRAEEHGLTRDMVNDLLRDAQVRRPADPAELTFEVTERASTFGRAELLQALAAAQPSGARIVELEALVDSVLAGADVVALGKAAAKAGVIEARYTTQELLDTEARLLGSARTRRRSHVARVDAWTLRQQLHRHSTLSAEQRDVVRELCGGGDGVSVVRAAAGTGKTFSSTPPARPGRPTTSGSSAVRSQRAPRSSSKTTCQRPRRTSRGRGC